MEDESCISLNKVVWGLIWILAFRLPLRCEGEVEVDVVDQNTETTVTFKLFQPAFMYFHVHLKGSNEKQKIVFFSQILQQNNTYIDNSIWISDYDSKKTGYNNQYNKKENKEYLHSFV